MAANLKKKERKKASVDFTADNYAKLVEFAKVFATTTGRMLNYIISVLLFLRSDVRRDLAAYCALRVEELNRIASSTQGFDRQDLEEQKKQYKDLADFLSHGDVKLAQADLSEKMKTTALKHGACVYYPMGWITVKLGSDKLFDNACVVEIRNGYKYDAPHFLVLCNKKCKDLTEEDIEMIYKLCEDQYPRFAEIQKLQVEPIREKGTTGRLLNDADYMQAPRIGIFALYEQGDPEYPDDYVPPYGAMIVKSTDYSSEEE